MPATRGLPLALALCLPACFIPNSAGTTTSTGDSSTSTGQPVTTGAPDPSTTSTTSTTSAVPTSSSGPAQTSGPDTSSSDDSSSSADTSTSTSPPETTTTTSTTDTTDETTMPMTTGKPECNLPAQCRPSPDECHLADCIANQCELVPTPPGVFCKGGLDQCDGSGNCIECVDNDGCELGLSCENSLCVPN